MNTNTIYLKADGLFYVYITIWFIANKISADKSEGILFSNKKKKINTNLSILY
jgi:hypothetical protein